MVKNKGHPYPLFFTAFRSNQHIISIDGSSKKRN
jgi:hypothetical protein